MSNQIKILFIASGNSPQGMSSIIKNQGESLQKAGLEINFFSIKGKGFIGYLKNILELKKYVSVQEFDIIHAHYGLTAIAALAAKKREKIVVSFMGDDLIGSNNLDGSVTIVSRLIVFINNLLARLFYDFCIVKSLEMYNKLKAKRKALIANGIDLQKFYFIDKERAFSEINIEKGEKVAIFVSDPLRIEKNFKLAFESIRGISDFKVNLIPISGIDDSKMVYYYNVADVLVLTSFHEGSPNVIKEAMACNCPIVSTDVGDVKWIIGDTQGCFISSFDPDDFSKKIKLAIDFRNTHGQSNSRERIIELGLDSETVAGKIIEVYKAVLNY